MMLAVRRVSYRYNTYILGIVLLLLKKKKTYDRIFLFQIVNTNTRKNARRGSLTARITSSDKPPFCRLFCSAYLWDYFLYMLHLLVLPQFH